LPSLVLIKPKNLRIFWL